MFPSESLSGNIFYDERFVIVISNLTKTVASTVPHARMFLTLQLSQWLVQFLKVNCLKSRMEQRLDSNCCLVQVTIVTVVSSDSYCRLRRQLLSLETTVVA